MIKFRSMVVGAEQRQHELLHLNEGDRVFKITDDPRVTRVGRVIRRLHLDELPQLVNVVRGEMSLVGPRPLPLAEDRRIEGWHRRRLDLRPGITGPWQVLGSAKLPVALIACVAACALAVRATRRIGSADPDPRRRARITTRLVLAAIGVVAAIGLATGAAYRAWDEFSGDEPVAAAAAADPGERLTSAAGYRYAYWGAAIVAFGSDPPGGRRAGDVRDWWRAEGSRMERVRDAHSVFLEQLAELGLPGLACVLALFGGALWAGLRPHPAHRRPAAALAMAAVFCAFTAAAAIDWIWEFSALTVLALLAITAAGAAGSAPASRSRERRTRQFPPRLRVALVIVALAGAAVQVPGLVSAQREMVRLDYQYVADWSLWNDIRILLLTLGHIARARGV